MKDLLMYLATSLADYPNDVTIEENETDKSITFTLNVNEKDKGKIIGKQGKNAQAIRTIMKAAGSKTDKKVIIDII